MDKRKVAIELIKLAKELTASWPRKKVVRELQKVTGRSFFFRTTEDFGLQEGGIWTSNEDTFIDPDDGEETLMRLNNRTPKSIQKILNRAGWRIEPYDSGTLMIWPD